MTRFTYGALHPLNIEQLTLAEVSEYLAALRKHEADEAVRQRAAAAARR